LFQVQKLRRDSVPRSKRDPEWSARKRKIKGAKPLILRKFFQVRENKEAQEEELQQPSDQLQGEIWTVRSVFKQEERAQGENKSQSLDLGVKDQKSLDPCKVNAP
jgi:hypothetical protein